jgi:OOP family OmpA-OmpF porin
MSFMNKAMVLAVVALLTACAGYGNNHSSVMALNNAQAVGAPFTKFLAAEYRALSNALYENHFSHSDAGYFARKGMAAVNGTIVMPEAISSDWGIRDQDVGEILNARAMLLNALDNGGRDRVPDRAASAQVRFDCWMAQQGRFWDVDPFCKARFRDAMRELMAAIVPASVVPEMPAVVSAPVAAAEDFPAPIGDAARGGMASVQQAMFIVFFDWNKYSLTSSANDVLDAIAQELQARHDVKRIVVVGHADTSGEAKYNEKLSLQRANAVRAALVARGISASKLAAEGRGESELLVKTPDNMREPGNRRAQITLE